MLVQTSVECCFSMTLLCWKSLSYRPRTGTVQKVLFISGLSDGGVRKQQRGSCMQDVAAYVEIEGKH
jgi:hypothetical protein